MQDTVRAPERDQSQAREPSNPPHRKPRLTTTDPSTGRAGKSYEGHTADEALAIARQAHEAWRSWRRTSFPQRAELMRKAAAVLRRERDRFAELMTAEMGKTITDGR